jgi:hypothetical protein
MVPCFNNNNPHFCAVRYTLIIVLIASSSFTAAVQTYPPQLSSAEDFPNQITTSQLPDTGWNFSDMASIIHLPPPTTGSWTSRDHLPSLWDFQKAIVNGESKVVRGVYVPGFMALPVVQQPRGNTGFVSEKAQTVTQFQLAAQNNVVGLLAHNYLSGKEFYRLANGLQVMLVLGDGSVQQYQITGLHRYQKLTPGSNWSYYLDLETGEKFSTYQVFNRFYKGEHHLTFQTCLEKDGLETWGLIFIVAEPLA